MAGSRYTPDKAADYMNQMSPRELNEAAHVQSDVDSGPMALHHRIGSGSGMAADGAEFARLKRALVYASAELVINSPWQTGTTDTDPYSSTSFNARSTATINGGIGTIEGRVFNESGGTITLTASTVVGDIPVGFRPSKAIRGLVTIGSVSGAIVMRQVVYAQGGSVTIVAGAAGADNFVVPDGGTFYLFPVSYRVDGYRQTLEL